MPEVSASRYLTTATWDDVPHLTAAARADILAGTPPHLRDARSQGTPSLGAGAIYPTPLSEVVVKPFQLPAFWPRVYGLDVGWNRTAAVWAAWNRDQDCVYVYTEHYRGQAEPSIHATAIRARGAWIPGVIDPASRGRSQVDGEQIIKLYRDLGLHVTPANNKVAGGETGQEGGIYAVWERLSTGRLKIFSTCTNLLEEYRWYRRDEKGRIVKERDHAIDALRYIVMSGLRVATVEPVKRAAVQTRTTGDVMIGY